MEMLVCIADNGTRVQPGDVICICPDGWEWSQAELSHPGWMVVSVELTQVEADALGFMADNAPRLNVENLPVSLTRADLYARLQ